MSETKQDIAICWIHKIAMKEIEQQEPIPEYGMYTYKEYKCPMCMTTLRERVIMDGVKLAEHLYKNIRQRKEQLSESLADGAIGSMEDYRAITGEIRGLTGLKKNLEPR